MGRDGPLRRLQLRESRGRLLRLVLIVEADRQESPQGRQELVQRQPCASGSAWGLARFGGAPFCVAVLAVIRSTFSLQRCLPWRCSQCWSRVWPQLLAAQLALQLAVQRTQQLAAQQRARSPPACDVFFSFFRRLGVDNRGLAAEQPTLADRSARAPSPCEGQGRKRLFRRTPVRGSLTDRFDWH